MFKYFYGFVLLWFFFIYCCSNWSEIQGFCNVFNHSISCEKPNVPVVFHFNTLSISAFTFTVTTTLRPFSSVNGFLDLINTRLWAPRYGCMLYWIIHCEVLCKFIKIGWSICINLCIKVDFWCCWNTYIQEI